MPTCTSRTGVAATAVDDITAVPSAPSGEFV